MRLINLTQINKFYSRVMVNEPQPARVREKGPILWTFSGAQTFLSAALPGCFTLIQQNNTHF